ncbi:MAG: hypothetical protein KKA67_02740 [Spirochaetes bacterium]|nr:hypothetical protein [Spirochaetota bacterium]MBU1081184.1 hypothetical protein [Spirochaetota bacterium]
MKKILVAAIAVATALSSCVSTPEAPVAERALVDRGVYNPKSAAETDLCDLVIHKHLAVSEIDGQKVPWFLPPKELAPQAARIAAGAHVFKINYNDGERFTTPFTVIANLAKARKYLVDFEIVGGRVIVSFLDGETRENAVLDTAKMRGDAPGALSQFIKYVMNPTMDGVDKTVVMESDEYVLSFDPDMAFGLLDKKTGEKSVGRRGFVMDFSMKDGRVYLLIVDLDSMSRKDFLDKSGYTEISDYVLKPVAASEREVTFRFEKPESMKGKDYTFAIKVID